MQLTYKFIALLSANIIILGVIFGWFLFPIIFRSMVSKNFVLTSGTETRKMWSKIPFPLEFHIYVFNITNPIEVEQGEKPILQEIGPYVFEEWKSKHNLVDNEEDDTVSFNMQNKYIFYPQRSKGLTGNERISIPHPLIHTISIIGKRKFSGMLNLIKKSIEIIFPNESAILTTTFLDVFFDGVLINCSSHEFAAKALCMQLGSAGGEGIKKYNETHYKFSILGGTNATDGGTFTVLRGTKDIHQLGEVVAYNNNSELEIWKGEYCNELRGTDGTIFPPFMTSEEVWAFSPELCRSVKATYEKKTRYASLTVSRYTVELGNIAENEELQCFCENPPHDCPINGTMDLMPCVEAPLVASMPHFCHADPRLLEDVIGLEPNEAKHIGFSDFETLTGMPLKAAKRIQFNMDVEPVESIEAMKSIRKMVLPIFWVEEKVQLNKTYTDKLKTIFLTLKINEYVKWATITAGIFGLFIAIFVYKKNKQNTFKIDKFVLNHEKRNVKTISDIMANCEI